MLCCSSQSDPEFVQWKKELTEAFTEAQKLLRRAPKVIGKGRTNVVELSKPPLTHRNSNGLWAAPRPLVPASLHHHRLSILFINTRPLSTLSMSTVIKLPNTHPKKLQLDLYPAVSCCLSVTHTRLYIELLQLDTPGCSTLQDYIKNNHRRQRWVLRCCFRQRAVVQAGILHRLFWAHHSLSFCLRRSQSSSTRSGVRSAST